MTMWFVYKQNGNCWFKIYEFFNHAAALRFIRAHETKDRQLMMRQIIDGQMQY